MRRELHAAVLGLAGATLLRLVATGDHARYVRAGLWPLLVAAGAVLLVVALASMWQTLRSGALPAQGAPDHHGHHHARHGGRDVAWLLVAPMLVALLVAPQALGSYSASRSGTALNTAPQEASQLPPLPDGDPVRLSVLEYASRATFDEGRSLTGRQVTLSGFLVARDHGGWYLTRMVVTCCAADAQPVKIGLAGAPLSQPRADDWWRVTGGYVATVDQDPINGGRIPYLAVTAAEPIPAPARQYVS